jgi:hypothetical protein
MSDFPWGPDPDPERFLEPHPFLCCNRFPVM